MNKAETIARETYKVYRQRLGLKMNAKRQSNVSFTVGDLVLERVEQLIGNAQKFSMPWQGPFKILSCDGRFATLDGGRRAGEKIGVEKLRKYTPREEATERLAKADERRRKARRHPPVPQRRNRGMNRGPVSDGDGNTPLSEGL